jgi:DNA mismatch endonuclease (patch repair protein)
MKASIGKTRSRIMASVRSEGNKSTELKFIDVMKSRSIIGWRRHRNVFGRPDFVFTGKKIAVFVDGCFWHRCPLHCRLPAANAQYWMNKIDGNALRDKQVAMELRRRGWVVIRLWEHDLAGGGSLARKLRRLKSVIAGTQRGISESIT